MPRSSGGGSHHGGSHHSSSHHSSSHSSGGGSHRSGSSYSGSSHYSSGSSGSFSRSYSRSYTVGSPSRPARYSSPAPAPASYAAPRPAPAPYAPPRVSPERFEGSRRYVRYNDGVPEYIYANVNPASYRGGMGDAFLRGILKMFSWFNGILLVIMIAAVIYAFFGVAKINAHYDNTIVITDTAGVFGSTEELEISMAKFYEISGVTPAVVTVNNETWQGYYDSLKNYAYDIYVNTFYDEYHWLLVYSQPKNPDPNFNDWYFECMQGDNISRIITNSLSEKFIDCLQRGFTQHSVSPEEAITSAFILAGDEAYDLINPPDYGLLYIAILVPFVLLFAVPVLLLKRMDKKQAKKYGGYTLSDSSPAPQPAPAAAPRQRNCEYCGSVYFVGQDKTCPQCGAPISAE